MAAIEVGGGVAAANGSIPRVVHDHEARTRVLAERKHPRRLQPGLFGHWARRSRFTYAKVHLIRGNNEGIQAYTRPTDQIYHDLDRRYRDLDQRYHGQDHLVGLDPNLPL